MKRRYSWSIISVIVGLLNTAYATEEASPLENSIRELRMDHLRNELVLLKREQYDIEQLIESGKVTLYDLKRLKYIESDLKNVEDRLNSIK